MRHYSTSDAKGWNDGAWLYPRAVKLLDIEDYRDAVLAGLILSANSRTDSTVSDGLIQKCGSSNCIPSNGL